MIDKSIKTDERKGYIFLCSDSTETECFERTLLGGKKDYFEYVADLQAGDYVFLFNYNSKKLHGPFVALTKPGEIVKEAWKGEYPCQVLFERRGQYSSLNLSQVSSILKLGRGKFPRPEVSSEQIKELGGLFASKERFPSDEDNAIYITKDKHKVRSKAEMKIDNWLFDHFLVHEYEAAIPGSKRSDFRVPMKDGTEYYIEYWGLTTESYLRDKALKQAIYKKHNLNLIEIESKDLKNLDEYLSGKFSSYLK